MTRRWLSNKFKKPLIGRDLMMPLLLPVKARLPRVPSPRGKNPKRRHTSKAKAQEKPQIEETPVGPTTVILDEEETEDDNETISLQRRRRRTSPAQSNDLQGLFTQLDMAENAESRFRARLSPPVRGVLLLLFLHLLLQHPLLHHHLLPHHRPQLNKWKMYVPLSHPIKGT